MTIPTKPIPIERLNVELFWSHRKIVTYGDGAAAYDCWEWTNARSNGYGVVDIAGGHYKAHRVAWTLTFGPIPQGLLVLHACDNPPCFNPEHLMLGSNMANALDSYTKGRMAPWGEGATRATLTDQQAESIKRRVTNGETHRALGREYGVNHRTIGRIATGERRAPKWSR